MQYFKEDAIRGVAKEHITIHADKCRHQRARDHNNDREDQRTERCLLGLCRSNALYRALLAKRCKRNRDNRDQDSSETVGTHIKIACRGKSVCDGLSDKAKCASAQNDKERGKKADDDDSDLHNRCRARPPKAGDTRLRHDDNSDHPYAQRTIEAKRLKQRFARHQLSGDICNVGKCRRYAEDNRGHLLTITRIQNFRK